MTKAGTYYLLPPAQNYRAMGSVEFTQPVRNYVKTTLLLLALELEKTIPICL